MTPLSIAAVILAAGRSLRMGQFKPLLKVEGQTLIQRAISVFQQNQLEAIIVVTGHRAAELEAELTQTYVRIARNAAYTQGMFSSVVTGIRHLPARCDAFFVLPVDIAFVKSSTVDRLIEAYIDQPGRICYPCVEDRRGHPPLIPASLVEAICEYDGEGGLRRVLKSHEDLALEVTVTDRFILFDLDEPNDLLNLSPRFRSPHR
jgi:CTP:molybdopterin cytidylyltransferase MocA